MSAWLRKNAQWIKEEEIDVNSADFRNASLSAWSKKVRQT